MSFWSHLMVHCSKTKLSFGCNPGHIEEWHLSKWNQVGYSMFIEKDGTQTIMVGFDRDDLVDKWEITNGAYGWNGMAKHICLAGGVLEDGKDGDTRTKAQKIVLENTVKMLVMLWPEIKLIGHNQVDRNKPFCPGFDIPTWSSNIGLPTKNIDSNTYYK